MNHADVATAMPFADQDTPFAGPLFIVATPGGTAPARAARLQQALRACALPVQPEYRQAEQLGTLLHRYPGSRFIALVEGPVCTVARWIDNDGGDASPVLATWRNGATQLLQAVQTAPHRFMCIDLDEARGALPEVAYELSLCLKLATPLSDSTITDLRTDAPGAMASMLAKAVVETDMAANLLSEELLACCMPLGEPPASAAPSRAAEAAAEYKNMRHQACDLVFRLGAAETSARERHDAATARIAALQDEVDRAREERDSAQRDLSKHKQDAEQLLLHLHQTQEELESAFLQRRGFDEELRKAGTRLSAESTRTLQAEQQVREIRQQMQQDAQQHAARVQSFAAELTQAREELERNNRQLRSESGQTASELIRLRGELDSTQQALSESNRNGELLLIQLHQVQEELLHYFVQYQAMETPASQGLASRNQNFRAHRIRPQQQQDVPPHRHLHLSLEGLQVGSHRWPVLEVRLLEHHGQPGLALFEDSAGNKPVAAWHRSGLEHGREFMLLVPADLTSQRLLQPMGSADWGMVTGLADLLQRHLHHPDTRNAEPADLWPAVVARLCRQLADLPPRLRYDDLRVTAIEGDSQGLALRFDSVTFGELAFDDIVLHWQPRTPSDGPGPILWQAPPDAAFAPLSNWPVDADGRLAQAFRLPVGAAVAAGEKRRQWATFSNRDRGLVLALLDALPAAAGQVADSALPARTDRTALARAAAVLHKEARRLSLALCWRLAAKRLLRRGNNRS